jgi:plasmid stabilization system protein ParE
LKAHFLLEARQDLRETARYYESQRRGLGKEFRAEVLAEVARIEGSPEALPVLEEGVRRGRVHRFPYGVFYRIHNQEIVIIAVSHLSRRPGHWLSRL